MNNRFVLDTCAIISFFKEFIDGATVSISQVALKKIEEIFLDTSNFVYIPCISLVEIHSKFSTSAEKNAKLKSEILQYLKNHENVSFEDIDYEVLDNFLKISCGTGFDFRDRIILAIGMKYQCTLITSDGPIAKYIRKTGILPNVIK